MFDPMLVPLPCEFDADKLVIRLDEVVPSDIKILDDMVAKIVGLIEGRHCWDDLDNIDLVLREALVNAIIHGNQNNPTKAVRVCVGLQKDCGMVIVVKDAGTGFDPTKLPNPLVGQNLLLGHGRGIFLINRLMDDVRFSYDRGTTIHMRPFPTPNRI